MEELYKEARAFVDGKDIGTVRDIKIDTDQFDKTVEEYKAFRVACRRLTVEISAQITPAFEKLLEAMNECLARIEKPSRRGRRFQAWKRRKGKRG